MNFDIKKVYTSVNADEVKVGSIGYYADTLWDLKDAVEKDKCKDILTQVHEDTHSHRFSFGSKYIAWNLFYLVEEPREEEDLCTYKELSYWLMYGSGEYMYGNSGVVSTTFTYSLKAENAPLKKDTYKVRKWGDKKWHRPSRKYMGLE